MKSIFIVLFITISCNVFSQSYLSKIRKHDTLYVFQPIGNVSIPAGRVIVADSNLSHLYEKSLLNTFSAKAPFQVKNITDTESISVSNYAYLIRIVDRIERLGNENIEKVGYGEIIKKLVDQHKGRYFCFIFYSGYESGGQSNGKNKAIATNSHHVPLPTEHSYLKNNLMIVDKNSGKIIYYKQNRVEKSPLKSEAVELGVNGLLSYSE